MLTQSNPFYIPEPENIEVGMESFSDFINMIKNFVSEMGTVVAKALNQEINGVIVHPNNFQQFQSMVDSRNLKFNDLKDLKIYRPNAMTGNQFDFANTILNQIKLLCNLEKDLIEPLVNLTGDLINKPESASMPLTFKGKSVDLAKVQSVLQGFYGKLQTNEPEDLQPFAEAFASMGQVKGLYVTLIDATREASDIDLKRLKAKEEQLAKQVSIIVEMHEDQTDENSKFTLSDNNRQLLRENLISAARETEYLSNLLYLLSQCSSAWNDSLEHLEIATQPQPENA